MDYRSKHIEKLINTLVTPKVNQVLTEAGYPTIFNVEVDKIIPPTGGLKSSHVSVMVHYKNTQNDYDANVRYFSYPICNMITNCIDYVMTDKYGVTIINILMNDILDSYTFAVRKDDYKFSISDAMDELKNRLMVD